MNIEGSLLIFSIFIMLHSVSENYRAVAEKQQFFILIKDKIEHVVLRLESLFIFETIFKFQPVSFHHV